MNCANHPDRERVAFCQNCGKPLCQECARTVGSAVFCEPCLAARLAAAANPASAASSGAAFKGFDYMAESIVPPPAPGAPSPGLATLLGLIPGVGAMYNGQYAKGVVHLIVFAILVSLANENGIFGLFVAGWVIYQAIEANHTARARLAGTPLPNPFGLNDLGERLGFGKAWAAPTGTTSAPGAVPPGFSPNPDVPPAPPYTPPASGYGYGYPPPASNWGAPTDTYNYAVPPVAPYGAPAPGDPLNPAPQSRFPTGAIWLIGLGAIFLIGNSGLIRGFPIHRLVPFFLIGLGVWLFVRKMSETGYGLADDGTPMYRLRLFRALRASVWVTLVGVLFFLDTFDILSWGRSWPLFIIVAGVMTILQRATYSAAVAAPYPYPPAPPAGSAPSSSVVPPASHDEEGK
jgi:hypothetical protein